jgi:hypothetical protein
MPTDQFFMFTGRSNGQRGERERNVNFSLLDAAESNFFLSTRRSGRAAIERGNLRLCSSQVHLPLALGLVRVGEEGKEVAASCSPVCRHGN